MYRNNITEMEKKKSVNRFNQENIDYLTKVGLNISIENIDAALVKKVKLMTMI